MLIPSASFTVVLFSIFIIIACMVFRKRLKKIPPEVEMTLHNLVGKPKEEAAGILSTIPDLKYQVVSQQLLDNAMDDGKSSKLDQNVDIYIVGIKTEGIVKSVWVNDKKVDITGTRLNPV